MDPAEILRVVEAAQGDPALIALAMVHLQFPELPETERARVCEALEVAAIPHWFDETILTVLLGADFASEIPVITDRLRQLRIVEPFPARGRRAVNVLESERLALRTRLREKEPERFRVLSAKVRTYFHENQSDHAKIESLFHQFAANPQEAPRDIRPLLSEWENTGNFVALQALAIGLDELSKEPLPPGIVRGAVFFYLGWIRFDYQSSQVSQGQARTALQEFRDAEHEDCVSQALDLLSRALIASGSLGEALTTCNEALEIDARLANKSPQDPRLQRDLAIGHRKLGGVLLNQGNVESALSAFRSSNAIYEKLAAQNPDNLGIIREFSVSHNMVGDALLLQHDLGGALAAFMAGLAIREKLAELDPDNSAFQRDLANSHDRVGIVLSNQGDLPGALAAFTSSRITRERLTAQNPSNVGWQRDISILHNNLGLVLQDQGNPEGALASFQASLAICEQLVTHDPENARWQADFCISLHHTAALLLSLPKADRGLAHRLITQGLRKIKELAEHHLPTPEEDRIRYALEKLKVQVDE